MSKKTKSIEEILMGDGVSKEQVIEIMYDALSTMQRYNGHTITHCLSEAMENNLVENVKGKEILEINKSLLDTTKIRTIEDLNNTDFAKYINKDNSPWVRYIVRHTLTRELNRLCALSEEVGTKIQLKHEAGRLYYKMRKYKVPKYKLIKLTVEDIDLVSEHLEYNTVIDDVLTKIITQTGGKEEQ